MDAEKETVVEPTAETPVQKKPKRKRWPKILGIVVAVLVVLVIVLWLVLDALIVKGIQVIGSKATGTPVAVESFSSSLLAGKVTIRNLSVGNPEGYRLERALEFTKLEVELNLSSLTTDTIEVKRITIEGLQVGLEPSVTRGSNLNDILRNVEAFTGASEAAAKKESQAATDEKPAPAKKVVIRLVEVRDSGIVVANRTLSLELPVPLPNLTMTDIGEQSSVAAAIEVFFSELLKAVGKAVSSSGITAIDVKALGSGLSSAAQDALSQVGSGLGAAAQGLGDGVSQAGEGIKGGLNTIKELF